MKTFVSKIEELKPAKELDFPPTPGFGPYHDFFPPEAVSHPAKANTRLLEYLVERYTREGETVLDPMAGTGSTAVVAALKGRNAVTVELEDKFVALIESAKTRVDTAPTLIPKGSIRIVRGDARQLSSLLKGTDAVITSPPYNERYAYKDPETKQANDPYASIRGRIHKPYSQNPSNIGNLSHGTVDTIITSPPYADTAHAPIRTAFWDKLANDPGSERAGRKSHPTAGSAYSTSRENIGNLPVGDIDAMITSPPYASSLHPRRQNFKKVQEKLAKKYPAKYIKASWNQPNQAAKWAEEAYGNDSPNNIGNLPAGNIDAVITTPPYGEAQQGGGIAKRGYDDPKHTSPDMVGERTYMPDKFNNPDNISNLKVDSVITSPLYEKSVAFQDADFIVKISEDQSQKVKAGINKGHSHSKSAEARYIESFKKLRIEHPESIGRLQKETYLTAMLKVYEGIYQVLKPGGLAVVIIKPFIRNGKPVDLPFQTWLLLRSLGFNLHDVLKLKLSQQSFWRILHERKHPDVERLKHEYIIVVEK